MNRAEKFDGLLCVQADYIHKDRIKALGARWNPERRWWELAYTAENWQSLYFQIPGLLPDEAIREELTADESDVGREIPEAPPMPLKPGITPFRHQQAAYAEAICLFLGRKEEKKVG